jgi:hypothetical protein
MRAGHNLLRISSRACASDCARTRVLPLQQQIRSRTSAPRDRHSAANTCTFHRAFERADVMTVEKVVSRFFESAAIGAVNSPRICADSGIAAISASASQELGPGGLDELDGSRHSPTHSSLRFHNSAANAASRARRLGVLMRPLS